MSETEKFDPNSDELNEDPLEALLDESSEEEFGLPEFRNHFSADNSPVVLKDWTAKEFASVYVRFKPHLERHARRYLNNQTQVEEVVQDAFLYLMTALPELDSELGVLRFLKWKTRLLALDVIRANSRASVQPLENEDIASFDPEMSQSLERADDAAIVSMALAKLNPRHREVLIASLYQEKSTEDISAELGLSDNATRQLIFRARSSFKKALVGEAETAGLRISEILSIAARKARSEAVTIISSAGALALIIGAFFAFNPAPEQVLDAGPAIVQPSAPSQPAQTGDSGLQTNEGETVTEPNEEPSAEAEANPEPVTDEIQPAPAPNQGSTRPSVSEPNQEEAQPEQPVVVEPGPAEPAIEFGRASLSAIEVVELDASAPVSTIEPVQIFMVDSQERSVSFRFDLNADQIFSDVSVSIVYNGIRYETLSTHGAEITADFENGVFVFESKLGYLVDADRYLLELEDINNATVRIQLDTDGDLTRIRMYEVSYNLKTFGPANV